jgi:hypothetical protein
MNPQLFNELKLFWGAIQEVADLRGCPHENIRKVLRDGRWRDERIEEFANQVATRRKSEMQKALGQS